MRSPATLKTSTGWMPVTVTLRGVPGPIGRRTISKGSPASANADLPSEERHWGYGLVPETDRRGAVAPSHVDAAALGAASVTDLAEEHGLAIAGKRAQIGTVEPGQRAVPRLLDRAPPKFDARRVLLEEEPAVGRDVVEVQRSPQKRHHSAGLARRIDRPQSRFVLVPSDEQELARRRRPRKPLERIHGRERPAGAGRVDDRECLGGLVLSRFRDGDELAVGRDSEPGMEICRAVESMPDRVLERDVSAPMQHGEILAGGRPRRREDVFEELPRLAGAERKPCKHRLALPRQEQRELSLRGDRGHGGVDDAESLRLERVGPHRIELRWLAFPGGGVDDGPAIRRKARRHNVAAPECQPPERGLAGRRLSAGGTAPGPDQQRRESDGRGGHPGSTERAAAAGRRRNRARRRGGTREGAEIECEIARGLKPILGLLLETVEDGALRPGGNGRLPPGGAGSSRRIAFIVSTAVSRWNARWPASIS